MKRIASRHTPDTPAIKIERLEARQMLSAVPSVIDLLVVYTPGALAYHGGDANALANAVLGATDSLNDALQTSHVSAVVRVVHLEQVAYTGSDDLYIDRTRLENPSDGLLDSVHTLRNQYGADLVALVVENSFGGGNASLPTSMAQLNAGTHSFTALAVNSVRRGNYTLAHEIGHTLGAGHERGNLIDPAPGIFSYSYGYRFTAGGKVFHDIMSYDPGTVIAQFANPAISFRGTATGSPIGQADEADLAATFAITAPATAALRPTVFPDTAGPTATIYQTQLIGRQLDVTIRYADPSGVDASTFDNTDLLVNVPSSHGGFSLAARFLSAEHPGVGAASKLVTYRAMLPENDPPVASLTYTLRSAAVADAGGHLSSAGAIPVNVAPVAGYEYLTARDLGVVGAPLTVYESLSRDSHDDIFRISVSSPGTISAHLDGLSADAHLFLARDLNGNDLYDYPDDALLGSFRPGTTPESLSYNATPGTYFLWVYQDVSTPYALSIRQYSDNTPPTATLDATDIAAPTSQFVFNVIFKDGTELNADLARYYSPVRITNPFEGFYIAFADSIDLDVNASQRIVTYRVNAGYTLGAIDNGIYTVSMEPNGPPIFNPPLDNYVRDAAGNLLAPTTLGTFRVAIGQADTTPPSVAEVSAPNVPLGGMTFYDFVVTYRDNIGIDVGTLDGGDIRVTGPGGFNQPAQLVSIAPAPAVGGLRSATYRLTPPGGSWDAFDQGTYTLVLQSGQVRDAASQSASSGAIGSFVVTVPLPGDANRDRTVDITDLAALATNWQGAGRAFVDGDFNYDGVVDISDLAILATNWQQSLPAALVGGGRGGRPAGRIAAQVLE